LGFETFAHRTLSEHDFLRTLREQGVDMTTEGRLTLAGAAEELGVHYMTAYRYVRTGRLHAAKEAGQWWVDRDQLAELLTTRETFPNKAAAAPADTPVPSPDLRRHHATMFRRRATSGDANGAWAVVSEAMAAGATPSEVHLSVIGPAMTEVGELWSNGDLTIAEEHRASAVAIRTVGRMTPMFRRKGRSRMQVIVGSVSGDMHHLPSAMLADLLSARNFEVMDLGGNTPAEVFVVTALEVDAAVVIGMAGATAAATAELQIAVAHVRAALPETPMFIGGQAAQMLVGAVDGVKVTASAQDAVDLVEELAGVRA